MDEPLLHDLAMGGPAAYALSLDGRDYVLEGAAVSNSPTLVTRPTVRGGVYESARREYRLTGTVRDASIIPRLTGKMLGPSTDFGELKVAVYRGQSRIATLLSNLTQSVQKPGSVELVLVVVHAEPA